MNQEHTSLLEIKNSSSLLELQGKARMEVSNDVVDFCFGAQTPLGRLFIMITLVFYLASIFFMNSVLHDTLVDISYRFWYLTFAVVFVFGLSILYFFLPVILFLSIGGYLLYMTTEESLLIYFLPLIVAGHIVSYIYKIITGDRLTIRLSSNTYQIIYRYKVVDEGVFSQSSIEIMVYNEAENGARYAAIFLPATKNSIGYAFYQPCILSVNGFGDNLLQEIEGNLEKLFNHLHVDYEKKSWIVKIH